MRYATSLLPTLKENPQDADRKSHRLMMRAGFIRKLASGTYSYLPLGLKSIKRIERIVRTEMDAAGAQELLLPAVHPAELWKASGRWDVLGDDMIHFTDRHGKLNVLGPTHEEVVTDLIRREVQSYKQLPLLVYQIQTKFRDELRPRSGVIRSREFIMKDAYSFHLNESCLDKTYVKMRETYKRIFEKCGLKAHCIAADPGAMGGSGSEEFVIFSDAGEDHVVQYHSGKVVAHEMATRKLKGLKISSPKVKSQMQATPTPGASSIESVAKFLQKTPQALVKTMIYQITDLKTGKIKRTFGVLVRGDHEVSDYKVRCHEKGASLATPATIQALGSCFGFSGPVASKEAPGLMKLDLYVDEDVAAMSSMIVGGNQKDMHLTQVSWSDIISSSSRQIQVGDFRLVVAGDTGDDGKALRIETAIEMGHIFKLNTRYSDPLKATVLDESGKTKAMLMGCYGIGINRILAGAIEQAADDNGIVWANTAICPLDVMILPLNMKDEPTKQAAEALYKQCLARGWQVLLDDRDTTAGVKFNDADLLGLPIQVVLGPRNVKQAKCELRVRAHAKPELIDLKDAEQRLEAHLQTGGST